MALKVALLFAAASFLPTVTGQSYSYSYYYTAVVFDPTPLPVPAPTVTATMPPTASPVASGPAATKTVTVSVAMAVSGFACSAYTAAEELVFETAIESFFTEMSGNAAASGCSDVSRRRELLSSSVSLSFTLTLTVGASYSLSDVASSVQSVLAAAVADGSFATALLAAVASTGYSGSLDFSAITVTGVTAAVPASPTASPVAATTTTITAGSERTAPGLLFACAAAALSLWVA